MEVILDNAYEAVSNSMKYSKCNKIKINIYVLNQMIRCSISDNGMGCKEIIDGMGISGMRKRIREINGILDFETEIVEYNGRHALQLSCKKTLPQIFVKTGNVDAKIYDIIETTMQHTWNTTYSQVG